MPAKIRFDRQSIIEAAFEVVKTRGIDALNARSLAYELGSSTQPIFSNFSSMDDIVEIIYDLSIDSFRNFVNKGLSETNPVVGLSFAIAQFATTAPYLYEVLFIRDTTGFLKPDLDRFGILLTNYIAKSANLANKVANIVFLENWIFAMGIAQQIHAGLLEMNEKALRALIQSEYDGTIAAIKQKIGKSR